MLYDPLPLTALRAITLNIINDPLRFQWTWQGLGMLRTYLPNDMRLHIWHPGYATPNVSPIHNHPWAFRSLVIAGELINRRYRPLHYVAGGESYQKVQIRCGAGGGMVSEYGNERLHMEPDERYGPGGIYGQDACVLHETLASPGTATIIRRTDGNPDQELATVWWKGDGPWVSAEPRAASPEELWYMLEAARAQLEAALAHDVR